MSTEKQASQALATIMAFDFGTKRIGVAVGQSITGTATPLSPLSARDGIPDWEQIGRLLEEWKPDAVLVGIPLNMDGSESEMSLRARKFGNRLHGRFHKKLIFSDERLTSFEAKGMVIERGGNRNFGENSVDGLAAMLLLEGWFRDNIDN